MLLSTKQFITCIIGLGLVSTTCVAYADDQSMEKCYGIAKAGMNDCDASAPSCDKSVIDGDPNYWLYVPKGMCNKIVGGMTMLSPALHPGANLTNIPEVPSSLTNVPVTPPSNTTTPAMQALPSTPAPAASLPTTPIAAPSATPTTGTVNTGTAATTP